tara:strand:- start:26 stop:277 length:252 start_codon:yes stop_codon:yes gene_type:complete
MKAGDKIKLQYHVMGFPTKDWIEFTVEEFRYALGIFQSDEHRQAGHFTPLCELYCNGPDAEQRYISNYGEYMTDQVPAWIDVP